jgi:hypothetical protein
MSPCFERYDGLWKYPAHTCETTAKIKGSLPAQRASDDLVRADPGSLLVLVLIPVDGRRMTIAEASDTYGVPWSTLRHRLRAGEPVEEALGLPWPSQSSIDSAVRHLQKRMAEMAAA